MLQSRGIKKVPFLANLGSEGTDFIVSRLESKSFQADESICTIGDPGDRMYIIINGKVKVVVYLENSKEETIIRYLEDGDYFGELSLLTGEPRSASVMTTEPSEMYVLRKADFDAAVERFPSIILSMGKIMSQRLLATLEKAQSVVSDERSSRQRSEEAAAAHDTVAKGNRMAAATRVEGAGTDEMSARLANFNNHIEWLIGRDDLDAYFEHRPSEGPALTQAALALAERAFTARDPAALYEVHKTLYALYEEQVRPTGADAYNQFDPLLLSIRNILERRWERYELDRIAVDASVVPDDPEAFRRYFTELCLNGSMADHRLFEFLEKHATRADLIAFFLSDAAVILRFCDLVVLTMVGADDEIRGELAENLWDEMGQGRVQERHVDLFANLLHYAGIDLPEGPLSVDHFVDHLDWPGLAGYNFYLFLCLHRRNQLRSLGALGAAESMDPAQYSRVLTGCRRVGFDEIAYYAGHESLDVGHGDQWLENVLLPLVRKYPEKRHEIALGAQMRINVTRDYYDGLAAHFLQEQP
jgi:CRP-like cAMP-binding protein